MTDSNTAAEAAAQTSTGAPTPQGDIDLIDLTLPLASHWRSLILVPVAAVLLAYAATYLVKPLYTAGTTFLPPQQQQSMAASALSSLGALAGISSGASKSPAEQFVALMNSVTVQDRLIDRYKLMALYDEPLRFKAREALAKRSAFDIGKKDGLISIAVQDTDPQRAAAIANDYVAELRRMTATLAISEAQQRRVFFEGRMAQAKDKLVAAQTTLQESGFSLGALRSEPKAAAEAYASLRAQLTTAQIRLQMLRSSMAESSPELMQVKAAVTTLQEKINALEANAAPDDTRQGDYVSKYREFKYEETLFEQMARQYEIARVDEAREGALIQVVDAATPPERRSSPKRVMIALGVGLATFLLYAVALVVRGRWRASLEDERFAARVAVLRSALRRH